MGLAATQARLLALTAQLNDVEFEGQQINNARVAITQASEYFTEKLYNMKVPTPPLKTDFTSVSYQYEANGKKYKIKDIGSVDGDGNTTVTTQTKGYGATVNEKKDSDGNLEKVSISGEIKKVKDDTKLNHKAYNLDNIYTDEPYRAYKDAKSYDPLTAYFDQNGNKIDVATKVAQAMSSGQFLNANGEVIKSYQTPMYNNQGNEIFLAEGYFDEMFNRDGTPMLDENGQHVKVWIPPVKYTPERYEKGEQVDPQEFFDMYIDNGMIYQECVDSEADFFIGTGAKKQTEYTIGGQKAMTTEDLPVGSDQRVAIEKAIRQTGGNPSDYYILPDGNATHGYTLLKRSDVQDGDGVATKHNISDTENALVEEEHTAHLDFGTDGRICSITINGQTMACEPVIETDEIGYNDAYAAYTYEKQMYDEEQAELNKQLTIIQRQDKRLELQLTELDTRRKEITTELDALKTVLGDASERGFKTFSG